MKSRRFISLSPVFMLLALSVAAGSSFGGRPVYRGKPVNIAREPLPRLETGITSMNISVHGVQLGMPWEEARLLLDKEGVPYLYSKALPLTVYAPPDEPTWYFSLNPSSYEIVEMGLCGERDLPRQNRFMADGRRWRLTTARTYFFGSEGREIFNEEGPGIHYPELGFTLKCLAGSRFRFVMTIPNDYSTPLPLLEPLEIAIPFFATGYWAPNTTANLAELRSPLGEDLMRRARIINLADENYEQLATQVDAVVAKLAHSIEDRLLILSPSFDRVAEIVIVVEGYADPRRPSAGAYVGLPVRTRRFSIPDGAAINGLSGNVTLSRLRAVYTARELEKMLSASQVYNRFRDAGKLRWDPVGRGEADGDRTNLQRRRAVITFSIKYSGQ